MRNVPRIGLGIVCTCADAACHGISGCKSSARASSSAKRGARGYTYKVSTKDGQSTYSVTDGTGSLTVPIRWMLGEQTQTWS